MNKKLVYILTWFPMFSESFVYNEINNLIRNGCSVDMVVVLNKKHHDVNCDLSSLTIVYPPALLTQFTCFILSFFRHPITVLKLIVQIALINRGDFFHLKRGYTSLIKCIFLLPLIIWVNRQLGDKQVHFHAHCAVMATTVAMALAKLRNSTFSFTGHGTDILDYGPKELSYRINNSCFFITVSEYNKNIILNKYRDVNVDKIHIIPAVVDTEKFESIRKASIIKPPPIVNFVTVARLSPEKGHAVFLRALARFYQEQKNITYTIIGDGNLRNYLQELVKELGIEEIVEFHGFCNQQHILKVLQESHVFVLTSLIEGLPVGIMEAAAAGLPIYATRITAIPEIVHDGSNGILVEPGDENSMYRGLIRLASNDWETFLFLSNKALKQDISFFDVRKTIPKIKKLMLNCLQ